MQRNFTLLGELEKFAVLDYVEEKRLSSSGEWCPAKWDALKETAAGNRELVDFLVAGLMRGERRSIGGRRMFSKPYH